MTGLAPLLTLLCAAGGNSPGLEALGPPPDTLPRPALASARPAPLSCTNEVRPDWAPLRPLHAAVPMLPALPQLRAVSRDVQLTLDLSARSVTSDTTFVLEASAGPVGTFFLATPMLRQLPTVSDQQGALTVAAVPGYPESWEVSLRQPLGAGATVQLRIVQAGALDCTGPPPQFAARCGVTADTAFARMSMMPVAVDASALVSLVPDVATLAVTTPVGFELVGVGTVLGRSTLPDGRVTTRYTDAKSFAFAVARYASASAAWGARSVSTHLFTQTAPRAARWRSLSVEILDAHQARFGQSPYDTISIAEFPASGFSFASTGAVFLQSPDLTGDQEAWQTTFTLAHELGHEWFGARVKLLDVQSPWLSEGGATYAEMEYSAGRIAGPRAQALAALRLARGNFYLYRLLTRTEVPMTGPDIYRAPNEVYFATSYARGAMVFQMLRYALGQSAFDLGVARYGADHASTGATAASFEASLEAATGAELTPFFDRWVRRAGTPVYRANVVRTPTAAGGSLTTVTVDQDDLWGLPLVVRLITADGAVTERRVELTARTGTVTFDTATPAVLVVVDPERQALGVVRGALDADVFLDGSVDGLDLLAMLQSQGQAFGDADDWLAQLNTLDIDPRFDLVFDGKVDGADLSRVLDTFGQGAR